MHDVRYHLWESTVLKDSKFDQSQYEAITVKILKRIHGAGLDSSSHFRLESHTSRNNLQNNIQRSICFLN